MTPEQFRLRPKAFALGINKLVEALPRTRTADIPGRQLLRNGTSVGANYRSACRARSHADFIAKLCIVEEECDESIYWFDLLTQAGVIDTERSNTLAKKADEILAMVVASVRKAKSNKSAIRNPQS